VTRKHRLLQAFGAVVVVIVLGMFALMAWSAVFWNKTKPLTTFDPKGPNAQVIQNVSWPVYAIAGVVFVGVGAIVLYIAFRFRDRGDIETVDEVPAQLHGKTWAEITWTVIPAVVLFVVALATVVTLSDLYADPGPQAMHVRVEGQQWWWGYKYDLTEYKSEAPREDARVFTDPEDITTANELIIPVGVEIVLSETSNDVIHSFWIPALNGKKDAVPGMLTEWKLQADAPGVYRGQCTEFCGLSHGNMRMLVRAVTPEAFASWRDNQLKKSVEPAAGSKEAAGQAVFKSQLCASCHLIRGVNEAQVNGDKGVKTQLVSGVAPDLTHFATRGTFAGSIFDSRYPNPIEPNTSFDSQPFGQTCKVPGEKGSGLDAQGKPIDQAALPDCREGNQPNAAQTPYASSPGNPSNPVNSVTLEAWLRDPPKMKPMQPLEEPEAGGRRRGMPNLNLSEEQIDQLVAYLNSLK
jgi:cytochrome c oxidase subunit 2